MRLESLQVENRANARAYARSRTYMSAQVHTFHSRLRAARVTQPRALYEITFSSN